MYSSTPAVTPSNSPTAAVTASPTGPANFATPPAILPRPLNSPPPFENRPVNFPIPVLNAPVSFPPPPKGNLLNIPDIPEIPLLRSPPFENNPVNLLVAFFNPLNNPFLPNDFEDLEIPSGTEPPFVKSPTKPLTILNRKPNVLNGFNNAITAPKPITIEPVGPIKATISSIKPNKLFIPSDNLSNIGLCKNFKKPISASPTANPFSTFRPPSFALSLKLVKNLSKPLPRLTIPSLSFVNPFCSISRASFCSAVSSCGAARLSKPVAVLLAIFSNTPVFF